MFPSLRGIRIEDLKVIRTLGDPSYNKPYNIYISFRVKDEMSCKHILEQLKLRSIAKVNIDSLKKIMTLEQVEAFCTMQSLNSRKMKSMSSKEKAIEWWPTHFSREIFVSSFIDKTPIRMLHFYREVGDGRIACSFSNERAFILVECWSL